MADKYSLLYSTNLVTYALHCSKSWILVHLTHSITPFVSLARLFSLEFSSTWITSVSTHLSLLLKLFLSLSFLSVSWSTVSQECNGSLTSSFFSSTKNWWNLQNLDLLSGFSVWTVPFCSINCQLTLAVLR